TMDSQRVRRPARILLATLAVASLVGACSSSASSPAPSASGTSASSSPTSSAPAGSPAAAPSASTSPSGPLGTVRLALDWTPNTDHTGFYVAQANGWYRDAGVDLKILPYGTTAPEALIAAGQTDCGISFQDALTFAAAGGAPIVSVMAILQHTAQ